MLNIDIISILNDNYSYIIYEKISNLVGVVDPSDFKTIDRFISKKYQKIDFILNTHHHTDHVGGNNELKNKYSSKIVAAEMDRNRIYGIDIFVRENDKFKFGNINFDIIFVPGHTSGHIAFYSKSENIIFTGDTLFSLGCGRIFEGTYSQMFNSLNKLKELPLDTKIYCGHEYTLQNSKFCLLNDPNNENLKIKITEIKKKLGNNLPTVPSTIKEELECNIFLRSNNLKAFSKLRDLKDNF